jgi:hypothetical protein
MNSSVKKMHLQYERLRRTFVDRRRAEATMGSLLLDELRGDDSPTAPASALVVILFAPCMGAEQVLALAPQWQASVPQAAFVGVELDGVVEATDIATLRRTAAGAAAARSLRMSEIVLLGAGAAGGFAVDLVLRGAVPAAGVIGLDISPPQLPFRIAPTPAKVRLVRHGTREDPHAAGFRALVEAMQRQEIDVRCMVLPPTANAAPGVTLRACSTFLVELVACASRFPRAARRPL